MHATGTRTIASAVLVVSLTQTMAGTSPLRSVATRLQPRTFTPSTTALKAARRRPLDPLGLREPLPPAIPVAVGDPVDRVIAASTDPAGPKRPLWRLHAHQDASQTPERSVAHFAAVSSPFMVLRPTFSKFSHTLHGLASGCLFGDRRLRTARADLRRQSR
jgi:hypothetical protein